jgi:HSP20 family molecular chaperone IbpA
MTSALTRKLTPVPTIYGSSLFNEFFGGVDDVFKNYKTSVPYNVYQKHGADNQLEATIIEVALAGYDKSNISVRAVGDELKIEVAKQEEIQNEYQTCLHKGISSRSIHLEYKLAGIYDKKNIESTFRNGLLSIKIPVSQEETTTITIND